MFEYKTKELVTLVNEDYKKAFINESYINNNIENLQHVLDVRNMDSNEFKGGRYYPKEVVEIDEKKVNDYYVKFVTQGMDDAKELSGIELQRKLAETQEMLTVDCLNKQQLFGKDAKSVIATDYDDTFNHCDVILETAVRDDMDYAEGVSGFDVTYSNDGVVKKLLKIENALRFSSAPKEKNVKNFWELKYYKSLLTDQEPRPIDFIPKFVIGFSSVHALEAVSSLLRSNDKEIGDCVGIDKRYDYNNHPLSLLILEEIVAQAFFLKELSKIKKNAVAKKAYLHLFQSLHARFTMLKKELESSDEGLNQLTKYAEYKNDDVVYKNMIQHIKQECEVYGIGPLPL